MIMEKYVYVPETEYSDFIRALNRPIYTESFKVVNIDRNIKDTFVGKVIYEDPKIMIVRSKRATSEKYKGMETYSIIKERLSDTHYDSISKSHLEGGFIHSNIDTIPNNRPDRPRSRAFYLNKLQSTNREAFNDVDRVYSSLDYMNYNY